MPSRKKKYNARFPAGRIKKIMQSDEEIGKVAQAVPVVISRTLELFVESLLVKTLKVTKTRNAKTLSISHMKQCIMAESRFDFLRELVKNIPDISVSEDGCNDDSSESPEFTTNYYDETHDQEQPYDLSKPSTSRSNGSISSITVSSPPSSTITQASLKRQWENVSKIRGQFENHSTDTTSKLLRMSSTPEVTAPVTSHKTRGRTRMQHQGKSVPSSSAPSTPISSFPAQIVRVDFCNEPIIKIDYSNLALHDNGHDDGNTTNSTQSKESESTDSVTISPVINIDLSNMCSFNTTSAVTVAPAPQPPSTSNLDLDEDYDNI